MALRVLGVARIKQWDSVWGSVVKIVTNVGTVELDDTRVSFDEAIVSAKSGLAHLPCWPAASWVNISQGVDEVCLVTGN